MIVETRKIFPHNKIFKKSYIRNRATEFQEDHADVDLDGIDFDTPEK